MKTVIFTFATILLLSACKKEKEEALCLEGSIQWGGEPAADGTGWTFVTTETNQLYILQNLPAEYKQDDLPVAVCLQQTDEKASCYCPQPPYLFAITSIKRR